MRTVGFGPPAAALEERELVITRIFDAPRESRSPNQLRSKGMGMTAVQKITPCLWFDNQAEDAAKFYVSIFENSAIGAITRYGKEGFEVHGRPEGSAMTVSFRLEDQEFTALNGGPHFKFTEAISLVVKCETEADVDRYWDKLTEGGDERAQQCGWLKDKFGVSWQIVPVALFEMMSGADKEKSGRAMQAMLQMKKLDLPALRRAYEGNS
jgi:predicted 3-demethylubiquinone-9 3-methyltransferase (glyoxalase superfamily)